MNASFMFAPEWGPSSLIKSNKKLFNSHSLVMKCAVIPRNDILFDEVQPSIVNEILLGEFYKNNKN